MALTWRGWKSLCCLFKSSKREFNDTFLSHQSLADVVELEAEEDDPPPTGEATQRSRSPVVGKAAKKMKKATGNAGVVDDLLQKVEIILVYKKILYLQRDSNLL